MSELYVIRHAQAAFGTDDYDRLSAIGRQQATALGQYFAERCLRFDTIISGTHHRHQQTLDNMLAECPQEVQIQRSPKLNEYRFTELHRAYAECYPEDEDIGLSHKRQHQDAALFYRVIKKSLLAWHEGKLDGRITETWHDFRERTSTMLTDICQRDDKGRHRLMMTSGGVISMLLFKILQLPYPQAVALNMQIRNSSITQCYYAGDEIQLASFNTLPHLDTAQHRARITLS